jgi:hypothetical protein
MWDRMMHCYDANGILILPVIFIALLHKCVIIELPIHGKSDKKREAAQATSDFLTL